MTDDYKNLTEKIRWLLLLRVVILSFFLAATGLFHLFQEEGSSEFFFTLLMPLCVAYAISIGSFLALRRIRNLRAFALAQVDFDVVLITGIIWITGDIVSPFSFLYNLAVMNAAILLFYRGAFFTAGFSSVCYAALLIGATYWSQGSGLPLSWSLLMPVALNIGSFFAIAGLSGFLANKLAETEKLLKEKQIDYQELDSLKDALMQGIGSGVAITDCQGRINYFNTQAQHLTALDEATVKSRRLDEVFPALTWNFDKPRNSASIVSEEILFANPHGAQKQLRLTLASLSNADQEVLGYVSIFEDITKQKQFEEKVRFEEELRRAREFDLQQRQTENSDKEFVFEGVIGKNGSVGKIYHLIQKVALTGTSVLITGESGTGKELVARAIHLNGLRKARPFVAVNCGAIPEALIESELFGHVRGAFTGAIADHPGLFKQADQGTIFLDEVGELPLQLQVKLLRVLQEKTFTPVGGSKPIKVDVRVISATNRDLRREMDEGRFREDLYYRLNVVQIVIPPLRNRKEDIPVLAHYFMRKFASLHDKKVEEISSNALMHLMSYAYPGNIRELENIIEHAVTVTNKNILADDDLPSHIKGIPILEESELFEKTAPGGAELFFNKGLSLDTELETHEKCILLGALKRANGVQKRAAEILGINYRSLRHRLEKYGMLGTKGQSFSDETAERQ
ncbi:MAG: PAS domain S-box protein [Deltaproteobacteria bacterium]|nr:PAS domain S-box protein [Deltaproteobacteria bacterium]